jgi:double-stranded uracil-DNA glycosylase
LYSAAVGHHFARPGNRFWKTLALSGFTPRTLLPHEEDELLALGIGVTNVVDHASASAAELAPHDYVVGALRLQRKVRRWQPQCLAFLGLDAYRRASGKPRAVVGRQPHAFAEVSTWALPNPSGLNAHYQLPELAAVYRVLATELGFTR